MNINNSFRIPMIDKEVVCIARSISKWTVRHMDAKGLREWGDSGWRKSLEVRQFKAHSRVAEIRAYKAAYPELTTREMGIYFEVSAMSISRALRGL